MHSLIEKLVSPLYRYGVELQENWCRRLTILYINVACTLQLYVGQIDRIIAKDYEATYIGRRLIQIRPTNCCRLSISRRSVTHSLRACTQQTGSACRLQFATAMTYAVTYDPSTYSSQFYLRFSVLHSQTLRVYVMDTTKRQTALRYVWKGSWFLKIKGGVRFR